MGNRVAEIFTKNGVLFRREVNSTEFEELSCLGEDRKRFDFVINTTNKIYLIEVNFYSGGGSKLNEVARSYSELAPKINRLPNYEFVWITDGVGWKAARNKLEEAFADKEEWLEVLGEAVYQYQKKTVRKMILKDHKRPDGRAIDQIRPLAAEVDLIPRVHGSAMFTRGQTQICTVTTLAPLSEAQRLDGLDEAETSKRYMHHYNFPSYSVGETKPSRGPGRREIGHGALAERALLPVLPSHLGNEEIATQISMIIAIYSNYCSARKELRCRWV